jgi:carboxypeptidase Taq
MPCWAGAKGALCRQGLVKGVASQMALMSKLLHDKFTDPAIGHLLETLRKQADNGIRIAYDAHIVAVTSKDYDIATRNSGAFVSEMTEHQNASYMALGQSPPRQRFCQGDPLPRKNH